MGNKLISNGMEIKKNIRLSEYSTFKTGGNARFFCEASSESDLHEVIQFAEENNLKFFILGGGSNILFDDSGFSGIIIKNSITGKRKESEDSSGAIYSFGTGEILDEIVGFLVEEKAYGTENLSGIPGTIGGAVVQNAGAYGVEMKDILASVEGINSDNGERFLLKKEECGFGYRESIFKKNRSSLSSYNLTSLGCHKKPESFTPILVRQNRNLIITKVYLKLNKIFSPNTKYPDLLKISSGKITAEKLRENILKIRAEKLPDWHKIGTAGSYFKNPIITEEKYSEISKKYPDIPKFPAQDGFVKISLGYVLDKICGLKGFRQGPAGFYDKQALVLVNWGGAKSTDIIVLENLARKLVKEKLDIDIETEVEKI